jgi:hypothetical protein
MGDELSEILGSSSESAANEASGSLCESASEASSSDSGSGGSGGGTPAAPRKGRRSKGAGEVTDDDLRDIPPE